MNPTIHPTQSDTRAGLFTILAGEDLTEKEGHIVVLTHDSGVPEVILPATVDDPAEYLLLEGGADGERVTILPLARDRNVRVRLAGTCNPGDLLTLAPIDGTTDGMVRATPAPVVAETTYQHTLRAEEKGVDGQFVLCRPTSAPIPVTVPAA